MYTELLQENKEEPHIYYIYLNCAFPRISKIERKHLRNSRTRLGHKETLDLPYLVYYLLLQYSKDLYYTIIIYAPSNEIPYNMCVCVCIAFENLYK